MKVSVFFLLILVSAGLMGNAQTTTFPSPGQQTCSSTNTTLPARVASDGVTLTSYLWTDRTCVDTDLMTVSVNDCTATAGYWALYFLGYDVSMCHVMAGGNHAYYRKPTYCYSNDQFNGNPKPLAIQRNSTANSGNCNGGRSNVVANFSTAVIRPQGLTFTIADIDNPYDSLEVRVYSQGSLVNYTFNLANPANSYVITSNPSGNGPEAGFDGSSWDNISPTNNWNRAAVYFTVDPNVYVDSIVMTTVIKGNRNDMNPNMQIGDFRWTSNQTLPVVFGEMSATVSGNSLLVNWKTLSEKSNEYFEVQASANGQQFKTLGTVQSKAVAGVSDQVISYEFSANEVRYGAMTLSLVAFGLLLLMLAYKNKWVLKGCVVLMIVVAGISCNKSSEAVASDNQELFVRIMQVDKDGQKSYSKVIKAINP